MNYSNEKIIEQIESGDNLKYLFFWGHTSSNEISKSCLSQWYDSKFVVNDVEYLTAEHWMMAEKALLFEDYEIHKQIVSSKKPGEAKELGRKVKYFNQRIWEEKRFQIVVRGNFHKFSQNENLATFLKNTKQRILVEASPVDNIWGIGLAADNDDVYSPYLWKGLNLLGYALMETRDILGKTGELKLLKDAMLPPWLAHPKLDRYDTGWRMGYGEDYLMKLSKYLDGLSETEMTIYKMNYPTYGDWNGWYEI